MSHSDREAIGELVHAYSDAVTCADEARWAACWADDATWTLPRGRHVEGRDAIVELWRTAMGAYAAVVQFVHTGRVEVDGDRATGSWHVSEHAKRITGAPSILLATYDDTYVRLPDGWRIASRALTVHYQGPPDLSGPFGQPRGTAGVGNGAGR